MANAYMNNMRSQYPEHMNMLNMFTGGAFSAAASMQNEAARQAREAREQAQAVLEQRAATAISQAPDLCSCQTQAAFEATRRDWTIYTASLGVIEPASVENYAAQTAAKRNACNNAGDFS